MLWCVLLRDILQISSETEGPHSGAVSALMYLATAITVPCSYTCTPTSNVRRTPWQCVVYSDNTLVLYINNVKCCVWWYVAVNVLVSNESEWTIRSCNFILRLSIYYYNCYPVLVGVETVCNIGFLDYSTHDPKYAENEESTAFVTSTNRKSAITVSCLWLCVAIHVLWSHGIVA